MTIIVLPWLPLKIQLLGLHQKSSRCHHHLLGQLPSSACGLGKLLTLVTKETIWNTMKISKWSDLDNSTV